MPASHNTWGGAVAQAMTATTWGTKEAPIFDEASGLVEVSEVFFIVFEKAMEEMGAVRI